MCDEHGRGYSPLYREGERGSLSFSLSLTEVGEEVGWGEPLVYHNGTGLGLLAALVTRVVSNGANMCVTDARIVGGDELGGGGVKRVYKAVIIRRRNPCL